MTYWHVAKEILFKDISILALVAMLFDQAECSDQFWQRPKFGPVVQEMISFEDIFYLELRQQLFCLSKTIFTILIEGIMRDISVQLF